MGEMLFIREFQGTIPQRDPCWYFVDARRSRVNSDRYTYDPARSFPYPLYIHNDLLSDPSHGGERMVMLRRFVNRSLEGDVLVEVQDRKYRYVLNPSAPVHEQFNREVEHGYHVLRFELSSDAVHFALAHGELLTRVLTDHHPDHLPLGAWKPV